METILDEYIIFFSVGDGEHFVRKRKKSELDPYY